MRFDSSFNILYMTKHTFVTRLCTFIWQLFIKSRAGPVRLTRKGFGQTEMVATALDQCRLKSAQPAGAVAEVVGARIHAVEHFEPEVGDRRFGLEADMTTGMEISPCAAGEKNRQIPLS